MNEEILYKPEEIAEKLKLSKYTIYEMIKRGDISAHRIGRFLRISDEQLNNYIMRANGMENQYIVTITNEKGQYFGHINNIKIAISTTHTGTAKISIRPDDIILSKEKINSSARNAHKGHVTEITNVNQNVKIKIDIGIPITTLITKLSLNEMNITLGQELYTIFKATKVKVSKN